MDVSTTTNSAPSSSRKEEIKPHAVLIPAPGQGHINAMLKLAKLLHFHSGFHVTFVHTTTNRDRILSSRGPHALRGSPGFCFEAIPDGLSSSPDHWDVLATGRSMRDNLAAPFRDLVRRLHFQDDVPPVSCIVSDTVTSFALGAGEDIGVPVVLFSSTAACGYMGIICFKDLIERGFVPLKSESDLTNGYLDTPIEGVPGMKNMRLRDFPSFIRTTNHDDFMLNFLKDEAQAAFKATAIIVNTFDDLEGPLLEAMSSILPPIYAIGPLNLMYPQIQENSSETIGSHNLYKEDSGCMDWLERKAFGSVIYVNFGSLAVMSSEQMIELAWGLANSRHDFLWVVRPDILMGETAILPKSFMEEVSGRGLITDWCPQEEVLMHSSIGGFLSHCGWNSTIESISGGVPMICWPFFADQQTNCRYLCNEWGVGVEIENNVTREEVEGAIKELLAGKKGMEMRKMATEWKECAMRATGPGGKSLQNFERVVNDILLQRKDI